MTNKSPQTCAYCGNNIIGRVDKKFCDDTCRTSYHNQQKKEVSEHIRPVNSILKRNRNILKQLNKTGKTKVHKDALQKAGFDFNYLTRLYTTKKGSTYFFCYDQGYLPLDNGWYVLVEDRRE
jgi:hypothetical protein